MGSPNQQEAQGTWDRDTAQAKKRQVITGNIIGAGTIATPAATS